MDLIERVRKVIRVDSQILDVVRDTRYRTDFDVPIERETGRALNQPSDFRTRKVLCEPRELFEVYVAVHHAVLAHLCRVDVQDLVPPMLVR